jgi:hypothetical protein
MKTILDKAFLKYIGIAILIIFAGILLTFIAYQLLLISSLGLTFIPQITFGNAINLTTTLICFSLLFVYLSRKNL